MVSEDLTSRRVVTSLLRSAGIRPSRGLGQNFLVDRSVLDAIASEVAQAKPEGILEIGPGLGTVTRELARIAARVVAVEIDGRLVRILGETVGTLVNVEIEHRDFLEFDLARAFAGRPVFVVGNIPYRITAPILERLVESRKLVTGALLLSQAEVVEKIAASPGRDGSALGVLVRAYGDLHLLRKVSRAAFWPPPEVESILWRLSFREGPRFLAPAEVFFAVVRALYGKRRKMIRAVLRDLLPNEEIGRVLVEAGISPTARGETLSFAELDRLALCLARTPRDARRSRGSPAG